MIKKRHHYVPKSYLKSFCADGGTLHVYRKDDPARLIRESPDGVGFHKYFYSQPLPDGGYDHDKLEDFFSKYETKWPGIVQKFRAKENVNDTLDIIFDFIALQRVRVPAARDACEKQLAETVRASSRLLLAMGVLPPPPKGFEDILDHVEVAIDPHQSILAMDCMIEGIRKILGQIGIGVLHNKTDIPFITSDNPVVWFDPSLLESELRPYTVRPDGPIKLMFPVAPDLIIYGDSTMRSQFAGQGLHYSDLRDVEDINSMNRHICRFAYESVFANKPGFDGLVKQYANVSPVIQTESIMVSPGRYLLSSEYVWGNRTRKPKWDQR